MISTLRRIALIQLLAATVLYYIAASYHSYSYTGADCSASFTVVSSLCTDKLLRFHIIANSDSEDDQHTKLLVRNTVCTYLEPILKDAGSREESENLILAHEDELNALVNAVLRTLGADYQASISLEDRTFPIRCYGNVVLPAGVYRSLCISLGEADGHNWWCILYPTLCFLEDNCTFIPADDKLRLKNLLTDEEYDNILSSDTELIIKFKLWELAKGAIRWIKSR